MGRKATISSSPQELFSEQYSGSNYYPFANSKYLKLLSKCPILNEVTFNYLKMWAILFFYICPCVYLYVCHCVYGLYAYVFSQKTEPQNKALMTYCLLCITFLSLADKHSLLNSIVRNCKAINKIL